MPTKLVVDCSTGITSEVELTAEEIEQREADAAAFAEAKAKEEAAKAEAAIKRQALLDKLGITQEEAALLLS
jgi:hypothetical protein